MIDGPVVAYRSNLPSSFQFNVNVQPRLHIRFSESIWRCMRRFWLTPLRADGVEEARVTALTAKEKHLSLAPPARFYKLWNLVGISYPVR